MAYNLLNNNNMVAKQIYTHNILLNYRVSFNEKNVWNI